jgi:hypothetical protein
MMSSFSDKSNYPNTGDEERLQCGKHAITKSIDQLRGAQKHKHAEYSQTVIVKPCLSHLDRIQTPSDRGSSWCQREMQTTLQRESGAYR